MLLKVMTWTKSCIWYTVSFSKMRDLQRMSRQKIWLVLTFILQIEITVEKKNPPKKTKQISIVVSNHKLNLNI